MDSTLSPGPAPRKRKKRCFTTAEKLQILNRLATSNVSYAQLGREFNVEESTIRGIRKKEQEIRAAADVMTPQIASGTRRTPNPTQAKLEVCLIIWLEDMRAKRLPVWPVKIRSKALQLYDLLKRQDSSDNGEFQASKGWYVRFYKKHELREIRPQDSEVSLNEKQFKSVVQSAMTDGELSCDQVFVVESTNFYWKKLPGMEGEERATILFCCNASGDLIVQPALYANVPEKAASSFTEDNVRSWFSMQFLTEAESYLKMKGLHHEGVILIADDKNHPKELKDHSFNLLTIPPDCNVSCLPTARGILTHLNAVFLKQLCLQLQRDVESGKTLQEAWDQFSINDATQILEQSTTLLNKDLLRNGWAVLLDTETEEYSNSGIVRETVNILRSIGWKNASVELINSQIAPREMTNEEILEQYCKLQNQSKLSSSTIPGYNDMQCDENQPEAEEMDLDLQRSKFAEINKRIAALKEARQFFQKHDKNHSRSDAVSKRLREVILAFKDMRKELGVEEDEEEPEDPIAVFVKGESAEYDSE